MDDPPQIEWRPYPRYASSLETLTTIDWCASLPVASSGNFLYRFVGRDPVVQMLRERYVAGTLTDDQLEEFVDRTAEAIKTGYHFEYSDAWVAVCWIVHDSDSRFAREFIDVLSESNSAELITVRHAAREARRRRQR